MDVQLTPDQQAIVRYAIESGRLHSEQEAVKEAMALRVRSRRTLIELRASLDEAEASLARGGGIPLTPEAMRALVDDIHQEGVARLEAQKHAPR
jgi:Arc/MetJ-type ribon-helix-helix transcriptional regulator